MNKKLKIASAAVAVVMAGTMAFGMFGCGGGNGGGGGKTVVTPNLDEAGKLTYTDNTTITTAIGYDKLATGMKLKATEKGAGEGGKDIPGNALIGDTFMGKEWSEGNFKPAWQEVQNKLKVSFNDVWKYSDDGKASKNLATVKAMNTNTGLNTVDVLTAGLDAANSEAVENGTLLNLADYLDYMPNFKKFLESDIIRMSLMATTKGDMYVAPYFDGNNDIEKFVLMRKDIVEKILDRELPATGDGVFNKATAITAYMGSTNYTVATTDPASLSKAKDEEEGAPRFGNDAITATNDNTVEVKVNYEAALAAAKGEGALHDALVAANESLDTNTLESGNIVDLMNAAIGTQTTVTGTQLINILRAYIDVAYTVEVEEGEGANKVKVDKPFYTSENGLTRASVFNSACAAWDVDLYAAIGRCYVASGTMFDNVSVATGANGKPKFLVSGRTNDNQRQSDIYSLVGELYGVRGLESRYNYSYIGADGNIKDTRMNEATWDAFNAFSAFAKEGLVNIGTDGADTGLTGGDYGKQTTYDTLSLHDYVQTQTGTVGFNVDATKVNMNMAPVVTPVSKWDTNDDGTKDTIMRFTESWRSVKTEGFVVSANVTKDINKLSAVLAFIDYVYSSDGQIVLTYGPQSTNGNNSATVTANGTWYATEATGVTLAEVADVNVPATNYLGAQYKVKDAYKKQYFIYEGKVYSGTYYNQRQIPTITDENKALFKKGNYSFTNHARQNLGTTFPLGNKDQGFEYQCTAPCGLDGSDIVNICLGNETIKHPVQTIDKANMWYTLLPTQLPYSKAETNALKAGDTALVSGKGDKTKTWYNKDSKEKGSNLFLRLIQSGYKAEGKITINNEACKIDNAAAIIASHKGMTTFMNLSSKAFNSLMTWYDAQQQD